MQTYSASNWDDNFQPNRVSPFEDKEKRNRRMQASAECNAEDMKENPSYLEKMMMEFLDKNHIKYDFQKIFYIKKKQVIVRYFIADFYIPSKKLIVETDGKFHKNQVEYDEQRSRMIKEHYGKIKIMRFTFDDFTPEKLGKLLEVTATKEYRKTVRASKHKERQKKEKEAKARKKKIKALKV